MFEVSRLQRPQGNDLTNESFVVKRHIYWVKYAKKSLFHFQCLSTSGGAQANTSRWQLTRNLGLEIFWNSTLRLATKFERDRFEANWGGSDRISANDLVGYHVSLTNARTAWHHAPHHLISRISAALYPLSRCISRPCRRATCSLALSHRCIFRAGRSGICRCWFCGFGTCELPSSLYTMPRWLSSVSRDCSQILHRRIFWESNAQHRCIYSSTWNNSTRS